MAWLGERTDRIIHKDIYEKIEIIRLEAFDETVTEYLHDDSSYLHRLAFADALEEQFVALRSKSFLKKLPNRLAIIGCFLLFILLDLVEKFVGSSGSVASVTLSVYILGFVIKAILDSDWFKNAIRDNRSLCERTIRNYKVYIKKQEWSIYNGVHQPDKKPAKMENDGV